MYLPDSPKSIFMRREMLDITKNKFTILSRYEANYHITRMIFVPFIKKSMIFVKVKSKKVLEINNALRDEGNSHMCLAYGGGVAHAKSDATTLH
jgi:hypothetical protein